MNELKQPIDERNMTPDPWVRLILFFDSRVTMAAEHEIYVANNEEIEGLIL